MDRLERLKRNPRILALAKLGAESKAINGIAVLFYLHRGLEIDQIFYLSIAWSVATLLFEIPTGYLADRFGRKRTLLFGMVISMIASVFAMFAHGFWAFCFQFMLMSFGFSCHSGTEEALLFDTLKETKDENRMTHYIARLSSARQAMKIVIPSLGALFARNLLDWQFQVLLGVDVFCAMLSFFILTRLEEPHHVKDVLAEEQGILRQSLQTIRSEPFLMRAALNKILIFIVSFLIWRLYQPYFLAYGVPTWWIGIFYASFQTAMTVCFFFIEKIEKRFHPVQVVFWSTAAIVLGLLGMLFFKKPFLLVVSTWFAIVMSSIREPMFSHAMNRRIQSHSRATTLSNLYVLKAIIDIPLLFISGSLALRDQRYVLALCLALCLVVLIVLPIRKKDFISE